MKKKSMEIATNTSSGVEKVEKIEQENKQKEDMGVKEVGLVYRGCSF